MLDPMISNAIKIMSGIDEAMCNINEEYNMCRVLVRFNDGTQVMYSVLSIFGSKRGKFGEHNILHLKVVTCKETSIIGNDIQLELRTEMAVNNAIKELAIKGYVVIDGADRYADDNDDEI